MVNFAPKSNDEHVKYMPLKQLFFHYKISNYIVKKYTKLPLAQVTKECEVTVGNL